MRSFQLAFFHVCISLVVYGTGTLAQAQDQTQPVVFVNLTDSLLKGWQGKPLPVFTLHDLKGKVVTNQTLKNKVVVINLWSTSCVPCIDEMPILNKVVETYTHKGIIFLAPAPETITKISDLLAHHSFKYAVLPQAQTLFTSLGLPGYPYHIVVDRSGHIHYIQTGTRNRKTGQKIAESDLLIAIDQALK